MYNPFVILTRQELAKLIASGSRYFVRQTYLRGEVAGVKKGGSFLLSGYRTREEADGHYEQLYSDVHRMIYDTSNPAQLGRLQTAAGGIPGFAVYINCQKKEWKPPVEFKRKLSGYINQLGWPRTEESIGADLSERYGELFVTLTCGYRRQEVAFAEFEK